MGVSNKATAADQTRAAVRVGFRLGIGGISGVTGQGVTVAVIDSGISYHPALAQKVIANVSFVSGDPSRCLTHSVMARTSPALSQAWVLRCRP